MDGTTDHQRYHGLDLLRAVAMLLGLVIHAPMIYFLPELPARFGLTDVPAPELWLKVIVGWIHQWRMPAFFLLAGFFAVLVLERRGSGRYAKDRFVRIGLALLVFMVPFDLLDGSLNGDLLHFWFLYYLMPMCLLAAGIWKSGFALRWTAWPAGRFAGWFCCLAVLVPVSLAAKNGEMSPDIPEKFGEFGLAPFLYFLSWFSFGAALYIRKEFLDRLARWPVIASTFVLGSAAMLAAGNGAALLGAPATLGITFAALGFAHRTLKSPSPRIDWLVELSYPIYIFHVLPAILLGAVFARLGVPQVAAVPVNIIASFWISVTLYYALIKYTPLNWVVNGYRKSWFKIPGKPTAS